MLGPSVPFREPSGLLLILAADAPRFTVLAASGSYAQALATRSEDIVGSGVVDMLATSQLDDAGVVCADLRASLAAVVRDRAPDATPARHRTVASAQADSAGADHRWWRMFNAPVLGEDGEIRLNSSIRRGTSRR